MADPTQTRAGCECATRQRRYPLLVRTSARQLRSGQAKHGRSESTGGGPGLRRDAEPPARGALAESATSQAQGHGSRRASEIGTVTIAGGLCMPGCGEVEQQAFARVPSQHQLEVLAPLAGQAQKASAHGGTDVRGRLLLHAPCPLVRSHTAPWEAPATLAAAPCHSSPEALPCPNSSATQTSGPVLLRRVTGFLNQGSAPPRAGDLLQRPPGE